MGFWNHLVDADYRNDGWSFGGGVSSLTAAWNNDNDALYVSNPANKGKVAVTFPQDPSNLPEGAVITDVGIWVRAAKTVSDAVALTAEVSATDNTSRFTSRDIFLSNVATDYEVGTYTQDPLGLAWDIERVNKLIAQFWVFGSIANILRIHKCWFKINYRERPVVTITSPSGNQGTTSPTLAWTYTQTDGDPQKYIEYKIFQKVTAQNVSFNPSHSTHYYHNYAYGDIRSTIIPTSLTPGDYIVYMRATSDQGATSQWVSKSFGVLAPVPGIPDVDAVPNLSTSGIDLTITDTSNILSASQANWETSTDAIEYTTTNATVTRDSTTYLATVGQASYKMVAASAATMSMTSTFIDCPPGRDITVRTYSLAGTTGRTVSAIVTCYDSNYTQVGSTITASGTNSTTWSEISATGTTPANTAFITLKLQVASPALSEVHYFDSIGVMFGNNSGWTDGGTESYNLLDSAYSANPGSASWTAGPATLLSSVTPTGTGNRAPNALRMTCNPSAVDIVRVAVGTAFTASTSGTSCTLNVPAGTASNDTMIATITANVNTSLTLPTGWSLINKATAEGVTQYTLYKLAGTEPASYTATLFASANLRIARVVTYRNVHTTDPFIDEGISTQSDDTPLTFKSASLNNTSTKAWRVLAASVLDNVADGTLVARKATDGGISFVGSSVPWTTTSQSTTSYTANRPSGVASGDFMLMFVSVGVDDGTTTINAPSGWTLVRSTVSSSGTTRTQLAVFKRTAGGAESASWSGTTSAGVGPIDTYVSAYRSIDGTTPVLIDGGSSSASATTALATATVNNTDGRSWTVSAFAARDNRSNITWASTGVERVDVNATHVTSSWWSTSYDTVGLAVYDSNGSVTTGNQQNTGSVGTGSWQSAASWIGVLKADPSVPAVPPAENELYETSVGTYLDQAFYDSNAVLGATGTQQLQATFTPGSGGTDLNTALTWIGLLRPTDANSLVVGATMSNKIDISKVDEDVLTMANNKVTFTAHFTGSEAGTPYLRLYFYRANQLLSSSLQAGTPFVTGSWSRSSATFDLPSGTTKIVGDIYSPNHTTSSTVDVDGLSINFGETPGFYRSGTFRGAHPVWLVPVIQYSDESPDGTVTWSDLPGINPRPTAFDPITGVATYSDPYPKFGVNRSYRVLTKSFGLNGDVFASDYSATVTVTPGGNTWWLKDIKDPTNNLALPVKAESFTVTTANSTTVYQPLGRDYPVVVTEGYKKDEIELKLILQKDDWKQFKKLINLGRTLFLQSDQDDTWWVRPVDDLSAETLVSLGRQTDPYRVVSQKFIEVEPEI